MEMAKCISEIKEINERRWKIRDEVLRKKVAGSGAFIHVERAT
jgi:hypothetical protein